MESEQKNQKYPYKLEIGVWMNGKSYPIWVYDKVPDGMRRITSLRELWYGRAFLYPSQLTPGIFLVDYMRETCKEAVNSMWNHDIPMYVSDTKR